uniref:Uncharacterized protein n=1 Tax=Rhizophora mucronata TaxID=61149 RepID=A0A2P2QKA2_RHIMU
MQDDNKHYYIKSSIYKPQGKISHVCLRDAHRSQMS